MSWLAAIPAIISAGAGLYGSYRENKLAKRADKRRLASGAQPGEEKRFDVYNPQQKQIFEWMNNLLSGEGEQPGGLLGETYGEEGFNAYADPEIRRFNEETIPKVAERFSALGAQNSSAFQNRLFQEGSKLNQSLGEMRSRRRQENTNQLLNSSLTPQQHVRYEPKGPSGASQAFSGIGSTGYQSSIQQLMQIIQDYVDGQQKQQGSYINPRGQITGPRY